MQLFFKKVHFFAATLKQVWSRGYADLVLRLGGFQEIPASITGPSADERPR